MLGSVIDGRVSLLWRLLVEAALLLTRRSVQSRVSTGTAKGRCPEHASTHSARVTSPLVTWGAEVADNYRICNGKGV